MKQQLLLLQDVDALGKKGDVVSAKSGYVRNFLVPKKLAVIASPNTLRKQERLRQERAKQAVVDLKESEDLAKQIESIILETRVKVDPEGHMYGSVSAGDIALLFQHQMLQVFHVFFFKRIGFMIGESAIKLIVQVQNVFIKKLLNQQARHTVGTINSDLKVGNILRILFQEADVFSPHIEVNYLSFLLGNGYIMVLNKLFQFSKP